MSRSIGREVGGMMHPSKVCVSIPGTWEYVAFYTDSKRDFAGMIKVRTLRWRDFPGLSG